MTSRSEQMTWRSRLAVAVGLGLAVAAAACSEGVNTATSPSAVTPSSLASTEGGQSTRNFNVTITPPSVTQGEATLRVTVARDVTSGQSQQVGSVEIYVPSGFTIESVSNISNNWTSGISGQTVRVGAVGGNHKLDGATGWISVTFDINVISTECKTYPFATTQASNSPYSTDPFSPNWSNTGSALSVTVTGCGLNPECKAAPAVANEYLKSINFSAGRRHGEIISAVAHHMTEDARFDGIVPCNVEAYRAAVVAYVNARL